MTYPSRALMRLEEVTLEAITSTSRKTHPLSSEIFQVIIKKFTNVYYCKWLMFSLVRKPAWIILWTFKVKNAIATTKLFILFWQLTSHWLLRTSMPVMLCILSWHMTTKTIHWRLHSVQGALRFKYWIVSIFFYVYTNRKSLQNMIIGLKYPLQVEIGSYETTKSKFLFTTGVAW